MQAAVLRRAFVAASAVWAVSLVLVPWVVARAHPGGAAVLVVAAAYDIGSFVCHQLPARSYRLWGVQMPVCARCAGIYAGAALAAIATTIARLRPPAAIDVVTGRTIAAVAVAPTLLTLVFEWTTGRMPAHAIRFAAGVPIGIAVACFVVAVTTDQVN